MKKVLLSIVFLMATLFLMAQPVPRSMVVVEVGTGTWCQYCPGAAMGVDDLLSNGKKVAVIENHNGDTYANTYSNARNSYYNITGYPTAFFDGLLSVVGGSHTQSMYSSYLPKYNQRINVPAQITLSMDVTHEGLNYTAVVTVNKVGTVTPTDLKLHFFVTQSHILQNWQGQTHLEHVNRKMVPDQNGTLVSFASGNTQVYTLTFAMTATWPIADCEFIAFVQSQASKETFNGIKQGTVNLAPDFSASNTQVNQGDPVIFTNATTGGYIGVPANTYLWTFPGGTPSSSTLENPVVVYNEEGAHDVTLTVDRGGQVETLTKTNYINVGTGTAFTVDGTISYANTAFTPLSDVTLNLKNSSGTIIGTTTTNASGTYSFGGITNGDYTLEATSTKAWGGVTASDVLLYKKHIGNIVLLEGIYLASGDVNSSGEISAADVLLVKKRVGSQISSFAAGDWLFNNIPVTVSGGNVTQNFNGLCYGDANGSYVPVNSNSPVAGQIKSVNGGTMTIGSLADVTGGQITIPVYAAQISNLGSFQFTIDYDPTLMSFLGTSNWFTGINSVSVGEPSPGHLTFVWAADATGISIPDNTCFNMDFTWNGNSASTPVTWSDVPTVREFGDWDGNIFEPSYTNGSITGAPLGISKTEAQTVKVYPNPASEFVELKSDCNIKSFEVISYLGQTVNSRQDLESRLVRFDVSALESGVYFVKVNTDKGNSVLKITVTR